ncbi:histidinol-phosphate transaminase [Plectonema cf. radiosum LEGE 06105]|uniref:Histidinol-phosphate aminotransferase n=1 Tax=Plectonema cf. radiosum LEGE 06105 TaxID=945769 RepID=A0A8J7K404_9CYAN|nr:histidinol-phosphate transaminase [Plectonema radiosum]MBE9216376.1 histidinol-phosphate transaminase [Plectonema cf. radiosum LEGE 06105]
MTSFFRAEVDAMTGYIPGEQPKPGSKIIKLNSNENPYPPSPKVKEVLQNFDWEWLRRYPNASATDFRNAISEVLNVPADWIIVGNGSDEVLNLIIRACTDSHRKVVYPMPTYILYRTLVEMQAAQKVEIDYPSDYKLPIEELVKVDGAVTIIATPNSPSGHIVPLENLRELATRLSGILVIDEAYVDFGNGDALSLVKEFNNVISIRTLSKGYSLAGIRLGFAIANPNLLQGLYKVKDSHNIDAIACAVGAAAIRDQDYKNYCVKKVKISRDKLSSDLKKLSFKVWDSHTNCLLVEPPQGNAEYLYLRLKEQGIWIRYFNQEGLEDKLRITVGTDEENKVLIEALGELIECN